MNTLLTILDQNGGKAEVQKWLDDRWLTRDHYMSGLADTRFADELRLPEHGGQYLEVSRQNEPRRPQKLSWDNSTADPKSGQKLLETKVVVPIEFIQDYVGIGRTSGLTSRHDLKRWADDDLMRALKKRNHELVQNAMRVGRMLPGVWDSDGTAEVAFDAEAEPNFTALGIPFEFRVGHITYGGGKGSFNALRPGDLVTMADFEREYVRLVLRHCPKINGKFVAWVSESTKNELQKDDGYMKAIIAMKDKKALADNHFADHLGFHWMEDDQPYAEGWGNEDVRQEFAPVHSSFCFGAHSFAFLKLGKKSSLKPRFKVQDITKTDVLYTIGYHVPFQCAVTQEAWVGSVVAGVGVWDPDNLS